MGIKKSLLSKMILGLLGFQILNSSLWALEIDEKLTTRFLKISRTKKTILLNRGLEDGLVVGDHAKFFLTAGVIARGVVVKASPTRSIWSIYRIIDDSSMYPDRVVNIKITRPLETTEDPSRSLYDNSNSTMTAGTEVMTMRGDSAPARVRTMDDLSAEDQRELGAMGSLDQEAYSISGVNTERTIEAFGLIQFSSLSTSVDEGGEGDYTGGDSTIDFSIGVEKYFNSPQSFLGKMSFFGIIHSGNYTTTSIQGSQVTSSVFEYGIGAHYHFGGSPLSYNKFIPFAGGSIGIGSVSDDVQVLTANSTTPSSTEEGTSSFISVAAGLKYFTRAGFGARVLIDYYQRSETYEIENSDENFAKTVAGPRILLGLAYRF
ncbi:MAG: hypothetical protein CME63_11525 [Halobacteriovoraceae bacterium]|nr:hypothetical protein [Halobacteriovoraceae bacterium]MBC98374.1 hypothetical protein [Halobacteriovoraceae bacterium]|tara:strand:+ start:4093 stop:5217 length:1125 start_codon:yes stop_codon:yes gene_type:complete